MRSFGMLSIVALLVVLVSYSTPAIAGSDDFNGQTILKGSTMPDPGPTPPDPTPTPTPGPDDTDDGTGGGDDSGPDGTGGTDF